ncbi:MAG: methyltransferase domain-containing protein [Pseudomonadota bacterium]
MTITERDAIHLIREARPIDIYKRHSSGTTEAEFRAACGAQNIWHSVDLGDVFIEGTKKNSEVLAREMELMDCPDFRGKTVLDIGAFTGWFSFEAERRGAEAVTAVDYYSWVQNWPRLLEWVREERAAGRVPNPYKPPSRLVNAETAPGRLVFDRTRELLGSKVTPVVSRIEDFESEPFDIVLYLGVLYHCEDPFGSLKKVAALTKDHLIVETLGKHIPGCEATPLYEFFGGAQVNQDVTTWWAPNETGLKDMLLACGFSRVEIRAGAEQLTEHQLTRPQHYRIWAHAWK